MKQDELIDDTKSGAVLKPVLAGIILSKKKMLVCQLV
jgi:hypothetical protein